VLLDVLLALAPHGPAFIVAGAQAVYLRTAQSTHPRRLHTRSCSSSIVLELQMQRWLSLDGT